MSPSILLAVVRKDLVLFFKNRFFALITVLGLVAYAVIYYLLPSRMEETIAIGLVSPDLPAAFTQQFAEAGVILLPFPDEAALKGAVLQGEPQVGIVFPDDLLPALRGGERIQAEMYVWADLPQEFRGLYPILVEEWISSMAGHQLQLEVSQHVLGVDRVGMQIPPRDRMLPLLAVFVLMMEMMGLASLISSEVAAGTIQALLVTRLSVEGLFLGKGITGVGMAFGESVLLLALTGGLSARPLLVLSAMFFGAIMITGAAFLLASVSRDMMSVMSKGILATVVFAIPALNVLLPGLTTEWIKALPSYYLVEAVSQAINYGAGWEQIAGDLLATLGFAALFFGLGVYALRRRFR